MKRFDSDGRPPSRRPASTEGDEHGGEDARSRHDGRRPVGSGAAVFAWGRALRRCLLRSRSSKELLKGLCDLGIRTLGANEAEAWRFDRESWSLRRMPSPLRSSRERATLAVVPIDPSGWRRLLMASGGLFRSHEAWRSICGRPSGNGHHQGEPSANPTGDDACVVGCPVGSWQQPLGWVTWRFEVARQVPPAMADLAAEIAAWTPVVLGLRRSVRITRRRVASKAVDRLTMLSARGLVHDLDNALLPLRCRLDLLALQVRAAAAKQTLSGVAAGLEHLQDLAADLRNRLDRAEASPERIELRLSEWWRTARSAVESLLPPSQSLAVDLPADLGTVAVREVRLTQAIGNLVSNAAKAAGRDGCISLAASAHRRDWIEVRVEDDGPGIAPSAAQVAAGHDAAGRGNGRGVGLGLAIVHGVAKECGGAFLIRPRRGGGTVAILRMPRADRDAVPPRSHDGSDGTAGGDCR